MASKIYETQFLLGARVQGSFGKSFDTVNRRLRGTQSALAGLGSQLKSMIGFAIVAQQIGAAVTKSHEFKKQMDDVATLLDGKVGPKIKTMGLQVQKMSVQAGLSTEIITGGLYETISAYGESADSVVKATVAVKAAKSGNADMISSVKLLSTITKGYGDISATATNKAADLVFMTIKLGQTTFPELAASMGAVVPIANTMKVSQEELFGAMATLTGVTGNAAEVSTQVRGVLNSLIKPTAQMEAALKKLGYANGQAMIKSLGLRGTLLKLKTATGGNDVVFGRLFGRVEAMNAAMALAGTQSDTFKNKTLQMVSATGAAEEAYKKKMDVLDRVKALYNVIQIRLGSKLLPILEKVGEKALAIWDAIEKNWPKIRPVIEAIVVGIVAWKAATWGLIAAQKAGLIINAVSKAWGTATAVLALMREGYSLASIAQMQLNVAMAANPIGLIITGVALLIAGAYLLIKNWKAVSEFFVGLWAATTAIFKKAWQFILGLFDSKYIQAILAVFMPFIGIPLMIIKNWGRVKQFFASLWKILSPIFLAIGNFFGGKNKSLSVETAVTEAGSKKIPAFAAGINNFKGGLAITGERGRELVNLPRGSSVTPADRTKNILNNSRGGSVSVSYSPQIIIRGNADAATLKTANDQAFEDFERKFNALMDQRQRLDFAKG